MLLRFLLLTVGLWAEMAFFGWFVYDCRGLILGGCYSPGTGPMHIVDGLQYACHDWVLWNFAYDRVWALFVIPTVVGVIIILAKHLVDRSMVGK